ncbi:hypothetical protein [Corynebacterium sp. AOP12-C2-36]|uniref:hypothetical protein n=1 Tax=Corynebacterium sp. AOP12-C2-36 TaxID=3457723 RepID=UPI004034474C
MATKTTRMPALPENPHAVLCRDAVTGKLLGRLTPEGTATRRNLFAMIMTKDRAEEIAEKINAGSEFAAKAIKF